MKVSRSSKSRAASRREQVMRLVHESQKDYRWWRYQDTEPAEGYVLQEWSYWEPAYSKKACGSNRIPPKEKLSRGALKNRLYRQGVPKPVMYAVLSRFANARTTVWLGERTIRDEWGYSVWKAVTRHVIITYLVQDEFWKIAPLSSNVGLECYRNFHKFNKGLATVSQNLNDFLEGGPLPELAGAR